jgi:FixJ family two-component response regulator
VDLHHEGIVYLVDDDEAVRDSMRELLRSYGVDVRDYGSAREFLEEPFRDRTSCLLLDLHMPGMSGLELLELLHERGDPIPVIVITGRSDTFLRERVHEAGAMALLNKPVDDEELVQSIETALGATRH